MWNLLLRYRRASWVTSGQIPALPWSWPCKRLDSCAKEAPQLLAWMSEKRVVTTPAGLELTELPHAAAVPPTKATEATTAVIPRMRWCRRKVTPCIRFPPVVPQPRLVLSGGAREAAQVVRELGRETLPPLRGAAGDQVPRCRRAQS